MITRMKTVNYRLLDKLRLCYSPKTGHHFVFDTATGARYGITWNTMWKLCEFVSGEKSSDKMFEMLESGEFRLGVNDRTRVWSVYFKAKGWDANPVRLPIKSSRYPRYYHREST